MRKDLQVFVADTFADCDTGVGSGPFAGSDEEGRCLDQLGKPVLLCNPVTVSPVDAPRESSAVIFESVPSGIDSLLCYRSKRAKKFTTAATAAVVGAEVGDKIVPKQNKHAPRTVKGETPFNPALPAGFVAPELLDTKAGSMFCLPTDVVAVATP
jgi:hypothetical protein